MCLALPVRVVELKEGDAAIVDLGGIRKEISLALVDGVAVGDYVILHVGYALTRLDPAEAERTLALFAEAGVRDDRPDFASPFKGGEAGVSPSASSAPAQRRAPTSARLDAGRGMGGLRRSTPSPPRPSP
jgi:hydrogenase expression/formation protein HypC